MLTSVCTYVSVCCFAFYPVDGEGNFVLRLAKAKTLRQSHTIRNTTDSESCLKASQSFVSSVFTPLDVLMPSFLCLSFSHQS